MTRDIKNFIRKRNHIYRNAAKKGHTIKECDSLKKLTGNEVRMIENAKQSYFMNVGKYLPQKAPEKILLATPFKLLENAFSALSSVPRLLETELLSKNTLYILESYL